MTTSSAEMHPGMPEALPVVEVASGRSLRARLNAVVDRVRWPLLGADATRSLRVRLTAVVKLAVVGGLAFAVGFLAMVAMRSVGAAAGVMATVSGPMLIANVVERLYTV